jgi:cytochrome b involved in lipid metabolism
LLYEGGVYDVRHFMPYHPGGELLIQHLLYTDSTDHINKVHPEFVFTQKLPNYFIGTIDEKTFPPLRSKSEFSKKIRELEVKMKKEGLFELTPFFYIREVIKIILLFAAAFYIIFKQN